jgi:hypothetical protein
MKTVFACIVISLLFIGCDCKKEKNTIVQLNVEHESSAVVPVKDIFRKVEFIKLETLEKSHIKEINKYMEWENILFIEDYDQKAIFVFNSDGKFLHKLGGFGHGPGEVIELTDFTINYEKNNLLILDNGKRSISYYTMEGKFNREEKIDFYGQAIISLSNNKIAFDMGLSLDYMMQIMAEGKILKKYLSVPQYMHYLIPRISSHTFYQPDPETTLFLPLYSNRVYSLVDGHLLPKYTIDFGKHQLPANYIKDKLGENAGKSASDKAYQLSFQHLPKSQFAYNPEDFMESDSFICFKYTFENYRYESIISKKGWTSKSFQFYSLDDDKLLIIRSMYILYLQNDEITGILYLGELLKRLNNLTEIQRQKAYAGLPGLKSLVETSTINDNPVLFKALIKYF